MYKVFLERNNRYWDPLTKTHLTQGKKYREFSDEFLSNHDMSNIEFAVQVGILRKVEIEEEKTSVSTETEVTTDEEVVIDEEESVKTEDEPKQCEAITSSGDRCKNDASYPEDEPKYCHIHQDQLEE